MHPGGLRIGLPMPEWGRAPGANCMVREDGPPGPGEVAAAGERLEGIVRTTPVLTSGGIDAACRASVFLKAEPLQRTGSFKFRGASNALEVLPTAVRRRGVLTYSSGNHAQALALAARERQVPCTVVMPTDAPAVKVAATVAFGAEVVRYDRATATREAVAQRILEERGMTLVPPYDHRDIIAGQGTAALELFREVGPLDLLVVPLGGGGLLAGSSLAAALVCASCRVVGAEPALADDGARSLRSGRIESVVNPPTIADGARTPRLGRLNFPIIRERVADIVTVEEASIAAWTLNAWERLKLVVEPTGALALAAVMEGGMDVEGRRVGVILSGGNVDAAGVPELVRLAAGKKRLAAGRFGL